MKRKGLELNVDKTKIERLREGVERLRRIGGEKGRG